MTTLEKRLSRALADGDRGDRKKAAATHSADSADWYTPPEIIEAARKLGPIKFDPASDEHANKIVGAEHYISKGGLDATRLWPAEGVWLNPPTPPRDWWCAFERHVAKGWFFAYSIEQLSQSQGWKERGLCENHMLTYPVVVFRQRVRFLRTVESALAAALKRPPSDTQEREVERLRALPPRTLVQGIAPPHASALVCVGHDLDAVGEAFGHLGAVVTT